MVIEQIYTGCLAHGAYYIVSNGEAAIVDPLRDVQPYLDRLQRDNVKLKYIFETHFHADFVSGHVDLSKKTGATIVYGPTAQSAFESLSAADGTVFELGDVKIQVLHTPGHTQESSTFLLRDETGRDHAIFSGDTLFLGDVGRPDLAQKIANMSMEELAGLLYESLMTKIMPLADDVLVYPAHGAGSACGKNMMQETVDTLGNQKRVNYALNQPSKEAFIAAVTAGLTPPPAYFGANVGMNKSGYEEIEMVHARGMKALDLAAFEAVAAAHAALILDTRDAADFANGFVPQSINIGLGGDFAPWAGALIVDVRQPILLVTAPGTEAEAVTRLSRVGFDNVLGHLAGGFPAWAGAGREVDSVDRIGAVAFEKIYMESAAMVVDVRNASEYAAAHVKDAHNKPLAYINDWIKDVNPSQHFFLHCGGGYRSMVAASILKARGYHNFSEIAGGYAAIAATSVPRAQESASFSSHSQSIS